MYYNFYLKYEPIITPGNEHVVHHMEIFHCDSNNGDTIDQDKDENGLETFPVWAGPCGSDDAPAKLGQCKKVLAAWAIGAGPFTYPKVIMINIKRLCCAIYIDHKVNVIMHY